MGDTERIGRVGLLALGAHRGAHMPCLQTHCRNANGDQLRMQPRRQRTCFMADAPQPFGVGSRASTINAGSVATDTCSVTSPASVTTQIAVSSIDTSSPAKYSSSQLLLFDFVSGRVDPDAVAEQGFRPFCGPPGFAHRAAAAESDGLRARLSRSSLMSDNVRGVAPITPALTRDRASRRNPSEAAAPPRSHPRRPRQNSPSSTFWVISSSTPPPLLNELDNAVVHCSHRVSSLLIRLTRNIRGPKLVGLLHQAGCLNAVLASAVASSRSSREKMPQQQNEKSRTRRLLPVHTLDNVSP